MLKWQIDIVKCQILSDVCLILFSDNDYLLCWQVPEVKTNKQTGEFLSTLSDALNTFFFFFCWAETI